VSLYPHTVTHPILSRCTDNKVDYEISESCLVVERETGSKPLIFAYPNGGVQDFDMRAKGALRRNGVRWSLSTTNGFADPESDPLALPRIGIGSNHSLALFRLKVSGFELRRPRLRATGVQRRMRSAFAGPARSPQRLDV
jgi:peptidoglycan/xylan/chitin deacetylase (PgdA/CDA1 family)